MRQNMPPLPPLPIGRPQRLEAGNEHPLPVLQNGSTGHVRLPLNLVGSMTEKPYSKNNLELAQELTMGSLTMQWCFETVIARLWTLPTCLLCLLWQMTRRWRLGSVMDLYMERPVPRSFLFIPIIRFENGSLHTTFSSITSEDIHNFTMKWGKNHF